MATTPPVSAIFFLMPAAMPSRMAGTAAMMVGRRQMRSASNPGNASPFSVLMYGLVGASERGWP
jgi:hypothetical protein